MAHPKHPEKNSRSEVANEEARKDPAQSHDFKGEAQNVNNDTGRPLTNDELRRSRNKANEGKDRDVIL